jgi:hypothetical protein
MRTTFSRGAGLALACAVLLLPACGGDGPTRPTTTTTLPPPPPAPEVVVQAAGQVPAEEARYVQFTTTRGGRLDITLDWTFATNDLDVLLVRGGPCTEEQIDNGTCAAVAFSDSETAKPERLTLTFAAAGAYTLYAVNFGPGDESAAFQVVLTPTPVGAASQVGKSAGGVPLKRPLQGLGELR